ncbi:MAG TPA: PadR family transcriptional regulator [Chloroflexota bacterium]|nr:PadR family transcriptional regulator [Chloroflexota bacterium]
MRSVKPTDPNLSEEYQLAATILLRGYLRLYILELLQKQPKAGSEIMGDLMRTCSWKPSPGSIYPMLGRLEREGLVESQWETTKRPKRVYHLTEEGARERVQLRQRLEPQLRQTLRMLQLHIDYLFGRESG